MDRLIRAVEWLGAEWIRFLVWFMVGMFVLPLALSSITGWINLDRFYDGLIPGNLNIGVILLVVAPYLLYLIYRMTHSADEQEYSEELFYEEQELSQSH